MLPSSQRLSKNQIAYLLRKGSHFETDWFKVRYLVNRGEKNRYALIISNKIIRLATGRNRLRRQIYSLLEKLPEMGQNYDLILTIKKTGLATKTIEELADLLETTLNKIKR